MSFANKSSTPRPRELYSKRVKRVLLLRLGKRRAVKRKTLAAAASLCSVLNLLNLATTNSRSRKNFRENTTGGHALGLRARPSIALSLSFVLSLCPPPVWPFHAFLQPSFSWRWLSSFCQNQHHIWKNGKYQTALLTRNQERARWHHQSCPVV